MWMAALAVMVLQAGGPLGLANGGFAEQAGGHAARWDVVGSYRALASGGRGGAPALEMVCDGRADTGAVQVVDYRPARRGSFAVTAWMRCEGVEEGGDCSLYLDVIQEGGPPIWGVQGIPDRKSAKWQQVRAEVHPTRPVSQLRVYLLLRKTRGKVRFCDVRAEALPLKVRELRLYAAGGRRFEVRAALSEQAPMRLVAEQGGAEVWRQEVDAARLAGSFEAPGDGPVRVTLAAEQTGSAVRAERSASPRGASGAADWWVADSFARAFQDDLPPEKPARAAALDMARGEQEAFQVCVRALGRPLRNVRVTASVLRSGGRALAGARVEWNRVGYVWVGEPFQHPYAERASAAWWPDPLLPGVPFAVEADQVQPLWFTVSVPRSAPPGTYSGSVRIVAEGVQPIESPLTIRVHPAAIPVQGKMKTAFALMDGFLKQLYGGISPKLRRAYTDYLLAHRLNPDDISRCEPPDLDEMSYANTRGLNAFNILNVVPEPTKPVTWVCYSELAEYTPAFRKRFFERLDAIVPELRKRGLAKKAYIYGFDERGPEYIPVIRDLFGEIHRRYPEVKTLSTCWPPPGTDPLSLNVDWFVPLSSSYNPQLAQTVRKRGGEMWWYVCMGPNHPYANWLLENPLIEARLIWWQAFQYDVEGFLYWGLNIWSREHNDRPIPDDAGPRIDWSVTTGGDYKWLNGDGVLLYPGTRGPIGSIRLESIRDGLEDTELLRQYRARFGRAAADALLRRVTTDRTRYSRNPADLLGARRAMLERLR